MDSVIESRLTESIEVKQKILGDGKLLEEISRASEMLKSSLQNGGKILICGNGGSASDSQHFAAEIIGRFQKERAALAAIALNSDVAAMTAIANDYGYEEVFARQVTGLACKNDVFVGISTSGNSENIWRALQAAKDAQIDTIALTGKTGGRLACNADCSIIVPSDVTARIQECHICIIHILCELVEDALF